jgi:hypothetical protein
MDSKKKTNLKIYLFAIFVLIFVPIVGIVLVPITAKHLINTMGWNKPSIDIQLLEMSNVTNQYLPKTVDAQTRLDTTIPLPDKTFQYVYTLVNYSKAQLNLKDMEKQMRPFLLNGIKTNDKMNFFRDNKVTLIYSYRDKDGNEILKFVFDYNDYKD